MVREHLWSCPLRKSPLETCGCVAAPTIPKAGQLEALGVPGCCFLGCCKQLQLSSGTALTVLHLRTALLP